MVRLPYSFACDRNRKARKWHLHIASIVTLFHRKHIFQKAAWPLLLAGIDGYPGF